MPLVAGAVVLILAGFLNNSALVVIATVVGSVGALALGVKDIQDDKRGKKRMHWFLRDILTWLAFMGVGLAALIIAMVIEILRAE